MQRIEAIDEYNRAQRLGMRDYREKTAAGKYPYLPALDELLEKTDTESQIPLGTIEIPLDYVVGTKTTGRTMAFASNFMPLLPEDTEFASKWLSLCMAHMEEGIHDAIKAYEYMGRFYVQEGNNRVSVLKYFGADSIFATVTRVVPRFNDTPEIREYYEFMEYYPLCGLYRLHFTQEGSFARLQKALGKAPDEKWTADDKAEVVSLMNWITSQHEFGRTQLDQVFAGKVETVAYHGAEPGKNADELVEKAIQDGADMVFTTSPKLVGASLRAALRHPDVRILNCSVDMPYASIRTYYSRVYEAKFITGAIAAAVAREDRVGYVADTPTFGVPANINACALGARMVNPRVKVSLQWSCLPGDPIQAFQKQGITVISGRDTPTPFRPAREFGTFRISPGGTLMDLASPFWHWGQFYENVVRTVLDGGWTRDKSGTDGTAVNYWWGMNSGVMDVLLSRELPHDVRHLANILRSGIIAGSIDPFACYITAQNGTVMNEGRTGFTPEQILHMDWLCDAVEGHLPEFDELMDCARPMYRMQGIHRDRLPAEKEADL